jgi:hypothetical protein
VREQAHLTTFPATAMVTRDPQTAVEFELLVVDELPGTRRRAPPEHPCLPNTN